ncbi:SH3 domain-containing protein [Bacillota bacterium Meth-B3]
MPRHTKFFLAALSAAVLGAVIAAQIGAETAPPVPTPAPASLPTAPPAPTPTPTPVPASPRQAPVRVPAGALELPIRGATGFSSIQLNLRSEPSAQATLLRQVPPGTAFRILEEEGAYWRVENDSFTGYLAHKYCMVNLPDVIPSIVYENTNASQSRVHSSGKRVPGVTGEALYQARAYDERLGREEFIMPVMYSMARKVCAAQQAALAQGDSLKLYEAYRPDGAQRAMVEALAALAERDPEVQEGISAPPWKMSWFISLGTSNHQRGCAIDVSLVKVEAVKHHWSGDCAYNAVVKYKEYDMPSPIHELSIASAAFSAPVVSSSETAWKSAAPAPAMNRAALSLQRYCAGAGLTPLASEWWHFNDLATYRALGENTGRGEATLTQLFSVPPYAAP